MDENTNKLTHGRLKITSEAWSDWDGLEKLNSSQSDVVKIRKLARCRIA